MAKQGAFTAVVQIKPGSEAALRTLLEGIGNGISQKPGQPPPPIDFKALKTVHFMRWVILAENVDTAGVHIPASLVLATNFDEPRADHLAELVRVAGIEFDKIYSQCEGFAAGNDDGYRVRFLEAHSTGYSAFYVGTRGRSVQQVRDEAVLRDRIQDYVDGANFAGSSPVQIHAQIRTEFTKGQYEWVNEPSDAVPRGVPRQRFFALLIAIVVLVLGLCVLSWTGTRYGVGTWLLFVVPAGGVAAIVLATVLLLLIRGYEKWEPQRHVPIVGAAIGSLVRREDMVVQNQLTNISTIKPALLRRVVLWWVLYFIHLAGRYVFVRGALGGIPSIHFARWVVVDRGRRLLFMSNFDGSWENYLGDFIDKASPGLTAIWSNTLGCPRAKFLVGDGARDERAFKEWVRSNQLVTQVWYSAYETLSVENINNNTRIRSGLQEASMSEAEAKQWLALL